MDGGGATGPDMAGPPAPPAGSVRLRVARREAFGPGGFQGVGADGDGAVADVDGVINELFHGPIALAVQREAHVLGHQLDRDGRAGEEPEVRHVFGIVAQVILQDEILV